MLRQTLIAAALVAAGSAHAALNAGDLAFTAFNADEDGFALATFVDIAANTTLYFQDNEWNGLAIGAGGAFNTGEGKLTWNSGAGTIAAGTVIRFSAVDKATRAATFGTLVGSGDTGLNNSDETLYAYVGATVDNATGFLAAVTNNGAFTVAKGTLTNTGLSEGVNAVKLTASSDFGEYTGARGGLASFDGYKPLVANADNWNMLYEGNPVAAALVPNTDAFTITPVPEPETYALMLAGLGLIGAAARRKKN